MTINTSFNLAGRGGVDFHFDMTHSSYKELAADLADMQLSIFQVGGDLPSAIITPEKQQAARDSTAAGKAAKAAKTEKAIEAKNPETPVEALVQAVEKDTPAEAKKPRDYQTSGIPEKITKAAIQDKDALVALLTKHKGLDANGKPKGSALPAEALDAFEAELDALLAG